MIVDLCKPLNKGESDTVRIILSVREARRMVFEPAFEKAYRELNRAITDTLEHNKARSIDPVFVAHPVETTEWAIQDVATGRYYSGYGSGRICAWGGRIERFSTFRHMVADLANPDMPETARPVPAPLAPAAMTDTEVHAWWRARPYLKVQASAPDAWTAHDTRPGGERYGERATLADALRSAAEFLQ
jgi:hypothetical protein